MHDRFLPGHAARRVASLTATALSAAFAAAAFSAPALAQPAAAAAAAAQTWPTRPVRLVATFSPGGGADLTGRIVGARLGDLW
jgi:tripartite-type tricarboxylate transporter receptor subunit TctC